MVMSADCLLCGCPCSMVHIRDGQLFGCNHCVTTIPIYDYLLDEDVEGGDDNGA